METHRAHFRNGKDDSSLLPLRSHISSDIRHAALRIYIY